MFYSHFGNDLRNGVISIMRRDFINDRCNVNPIGQWVKILVMANSLGLQPNENRTLRASVKKIHLP